MGIKYYFTKQKILSFLIIGFLLTLLQVLVFLLLHHPRIDDTKTPLAATTEAMFYIENSESGSITCIGDGIIRTTRDITGNVEAASAAIITAPDYSSYISNDLTVNWSTIRVNNNEYQVFGTIGRATDPAPTQISIKYFGAKGDGVTDDSLAFNTALKQLKNSKALYIPSGTYVIGSTVYIPEGTTIIGDPNTPILIASKGTGRGKTLFYLNNANNVRLENICISGNSAVNYENMDSKDGIHLLDIWNSNNITISKCKFIDNIYAAIRDIASNNITVDSCEFSNVDCGFGTLGNTDISDITITNNKFNGHKSSEPVTLYANASHYNILVQNNEMRNKTLGCGILVKGKKPNKLIRIYNNTIDACAVGINVQNTTDVIVKDNTVTNTSSGGGIKLINCTDAIYDNNYCYNTKHDGLLVQDCTNVTINKLSTVDCGQLNGNYYNVRFTGTENNDIEFTNSTIEYNNKSKVGICFTCDTDISMSEIEYSNSTIWLTKDSTNVTLSVPKSINVRDQGNLNAITRY